MSTADIVCRFPTKRLFATAERACAGAINIQQAVERDGGTYTPLYPYECPDGPHWHLTSKPQGTRICPRCHQWAPAWFGGMDWIISFHRDTDNTPCGGVGQRAEKEEEESA